ncbi:MAG: lipase maturation factor family protein [Verrucomicrobia bacterium]|nr:lipase maturation factor family protein [Verrucomicrobiota bacterium]
MHRTAWRQLQDFSGLSGDATYLWPRWLVLRAIGLVFVLIFVGILDVSQVLVGPSGLTPLTGFFTELREIHPNALLVFLRAPSLFWLGDSAGLITTVACLGLTSAVALTLNFCPRLALFGGWLCLLSFVTTWRGFSGTQLDQIMLEAALLSLPFAPGGVRPGLGAASPPRPIAVLMMRWLLFRVMFESGIVKLIAGDPHWLNLTAMDVLYETSPFPTILGYLDHQLPHASHVGEIALTFAAEIVAPLLAAFGGRRGRWLAFGTWVAFQAGIQLTNNFGWLNTGSIALGLLLLDDQMLTAATTRFRLRALPAFLTRTAAPHPPRPINPWKLRGLRGALWLHFSLTLYFFATSCGLPLDGLPFSLLRPANSLFAGFHSANPYTLYAGLLPGRRAVEFEGSNDAGLTWRTYEYRYQPQRVDRICPFIAPWYPRFEATLQVEANRSAPSPLYGLVAAHLLRGDAAVIALFARDPFPDRPSTLLRTPAYRLTFTDLATHRATGHFWHKESIGYYQPTMAINARGEISEATAPLEELRLLAEHGNAHAQNDLGQMFADADGLPQDAAAAALWLRRSANQGNVVAQTNLGLLHAKGLAVPRNEIEALAWFNLAAASGDPEALKNQAIATRRVGPDGVRAAAQRTQIILAEIAAQKNPPQ